jgi:3-deoxy-manno-octulosonate cytidylyltransferase (CMP-KDO synthetase)
VTVLAVVPARLASQRLPGKPLVDLGGKPMIQHVWEAASACSHFERVIVATDSADIVAVVVAFGGVAELTSPDHRTGTDRVAEVARRHPEFDVVANVQGDQPFVTPAMLTELLGPYLTGEDPEVATLACPLAADVDPRDPNVVKVVCDVNGDALYFSRSLIPHGGARHLHHLGLYAFRADFLAQYPSLPVGDLERSEGLEQLRALENGHRISVSITASSVLEVNTAADLRQAEQLVARA